LLLLLLCCRLVVFVAFNAEGGGEGRCGNDQHQEEDECSFHFDVNQLELVS